MAVVDDTRLVLLVLRLRGSADQDAVASSLSLMQLRVDEPGELLDRLELAGLVARGSGPANRWRLTDDGRHEGERLLGVELDAQGARDRVTEAYTRFLALNGPLLRVCTDWQLRDADPASIVVNDHSDPQFDRRVLDRLETVHRAALPICADLAAALERFTSYGARLTSASDRLRAGDGTALDGPSTDSYHAAWYELHENLIATLGLDRSTEPLPDAG